MNPEILLLVIPVLIVSIIVHEVAHGYAALFLGDRTALNAGRLTVNPISHIDPIGSILLPIVTSFTGFFFGYAKPVPYNPNNLSNKKWGEAIVAFAGPGSNIVLAILFAIVTRVAVSTGTPPDSLMIQAFVFIVIANLFLAFLNLIPVAPLDGSKILFSVLPYKWIGVRRWMEKNQLLFIGLVLVLIFTTPVLETITYFFARLLIG